MKRKTVDEYRQLKGGGAHEDTHRHGERVCTRVEADTERNEPGDHHRRGQRVKESGISLSEYIMPGVGGRALSEEHAIETANVLNAIEPDFIRVRTFAMHPQSPMQRMVEEGTFVL